MLNQTQQATWTEIQTEPAFTDKLATACKRLGGFFKDVTLAAISVSQQQYQAEEFLGANVARQLAIQEIRRTVTNFAGRGDRL